MGSHRRVLVLASGAAAALVLALGAIASAAGPYEMTLVITPNPADAGTTSITLSGHIVDASDVAQGGGTVDVYVPYPNQGLRQATVDANGDYTITLTNGTRTYVPLYGGTYTYSVFWHWDVGGTRRTAQTSETLTMGGTPNTAPGVSVLGPIAEASYEMGTVPAATCLVTDDGDYSDEFPATLTPVSGPNAAHGIGSVTASCSYTDPGYLTTSASVTYSIVDTTRPVITLLSRSDGDAEYGWTADDVALSWSCSDTGGSGVKTAPAPVTVTTEGGGQSVTATCTDWAGNTASDTQGAINIDRTPPSTSVSGGTTGWVNRDVVLSFHATDTLSGLAGCDSPVTLRNEGAAQSVNGYCWDKAGNRGSATASGIDIDRTAPTAHATVTPKAGWNTTPPTVTFTGDDALSGVASCTAPITVTTQAPGHFVYGTCADNAGNVSAQAAGWVMYDATPPTMAPDGVPLPNDDGWYRTSVTFSWTCEDSLSGATAEEVSATLSTEGAGQVASASCTDTAGNSRTSSRSGIDIDLTAPSVSWTPLQGSYPSNAVPAAPTCVAVDSLSGAGTCTVTGYGTAPGSHTLTATAYDVAGNVKTETASYTVLTWTLRGFYAPVSPDVNAVNVVKGGATVPLKFEILDGTTELTATTSVSSFVVQRINCDSLADDPADPVDFTTTGGTSLRYDATAGMFVQNWQTPKGAGCFKTTMTAADGSVLSAYFRTR